VDKEATCQTADIERRWVIQQDILSKTLCLQSETGSLCQTALASGRSGYSWLNASRRLARRQPLGVSVRKWAD